MSVPANLLMGASVFVNQYTATDATNGSDGLVITTLPNGGGGPLPVGSPTGRSGLTTYPIDTGLAIVGNSTGSNYGFKTGLQLGGSAGGWMGLGGQSYMQTGAKITSYTNYGLYINNYGGIVSNTQAATPAAIGVGTTGGAVGIGTLSPTALMEVTGPFTPWKVIYLTSGTSWTVPSDWNAPTSRIEVIGAGGNGLAVNDGGAGGGGYSKITNLSLTPGATVSYTIGGAGTPTFFNGATCATSSVCANGGASPTGTTGALGGSTTGAVGTTLYAGGNGTNGDGVSASGGGGGAAGPYGAGNNASGALGGSGDAGYGGVGATSAVVAGNGSEWTTTTGGGSVGAGGGGAGYAGYGLGGGCGGGGARVGAGGGGCIVITYYSTGANLFAVDNGGTAFLSVDPAGAIHIKEGTNAKQGVATLSNGSVVVSNTAITANSRIFLTEQDTGTCAGFVKVAARTAGTSFTIGSSVATDNCVVAYEIFEPN